MFKIAKNVHCMLTTLINGDMKPRGTRSARRSESFYRKIVHSFKKQLWSKNNFIHVVVKYYLSGLSRVKFKSLAQVNLREEPSVRPRSSNDPWVLPVMVQGMMTSLKQRVFCKNLLNKIPSFTAHTDCKIHTKGNWPRTWGIQWPIWTSIFVFEYVWWVKRHYRNFEQISSVFSNVLDIL